MLDVYITSLKNHIQICENAAATQNSSDLQASTHDLKSLCFMLKAQNEGELAESIEDALKSNSPETAFEKTPLLIEKINTLIEIMEGYDIQPD